MTVVRLSRGGSGVVLITTPELVSCGTWTPNREASRVVSEPAASTTTSQRMSPEVVLTDLTRPSLVSAKPVASVLRQTSQFLSDSRCRQASITSCGSTCPSFSLYAAAAMEPTLRPGSISDNSDSLSRRMGYPQDCIWRT